jgi:hypothetical protein
LAQGTTGLANWNQPPRPAKLDKRAVSSPCVDVNAPAGSGASGDVGTRPLEASLPGRSRRVVSELLRINGRDGRPSHVVPFRRRRLTTVMVFRQKR